MNKEQIEIESLSQFQHIRLRSGMYIGTTENVSVILREVIDNGVDELLGGYASKLKVSEVNDYFLVADNGRGIPIKLKPDPINPSKQITSTEIAVGRMNSGSKYNKKTVSVGLNGVGTKATNALSDEFIVCSKITKDNYDISIDKVRDEYLKRGNDVQLYYVIVFNKGEKKYEGCMTLEEICKEINIEVTWEFTPSTLVLFKPDLTIFETRNYKLPLTNLALVKVILKNTTGNEVEYFIEGKEVNYELFEHQLTVNIDGSKHSEYNDNIKFLISFDFDKDVSQGLSKGSVNSLVVNRGVHINEVEYAIKHGLINIMDVGESFHPYITKGLNLSVILLTNEISFSSQTKERLSGIDGWCNELKDVLRNQVRTFIKKNKDSFEDHIARIKEYVASLNKLKHTDYIKSKIIKPSARSKAFQSPKLKDCTTDNRQESVIFVVEGDSAGNNIIKARNREYQAVYMLRGKPLQGASYNMKRVLDNDELRNLFNALSAGVIGYETEKEHMRYGRIVLVTDADPDGYSIAASIAGTLAKFTPHVIERGMLYHCITPLYKQANKYFYDFNKDELDHSKGHSYFKGIGSLDIEDIKECITGPNALLRKITDEDIEQAIHVLTTTGGKRELMENIGILENNYHG